ncbi:hypothetical protein JNW88_25055 [Micromonospora sp. ATA32]|nr:hypothetical protein [Micromonospora sp. ATA32]
MRKRQLKELCRCDVRLLRNYMTPYLRDARTEITDLSPDEITERFTGWCARPLGRWTTDEAPGGGTDGRSTLPG